jgi:hypothetical protein
VSKRWQCALLQRILLPSYGKQWFWRRCCGGVSVAPEEPTARQTKKAKSHAGLITDECGIRIWKALIEWFGAWKEHALNARRKTQDARRKTQTALTNVVPDMPVRSAQCSAKLSRSEPEPARCAPRDWTAERSLRYGALVTPEIEKEGQARTNAAGCLNDAADDLYQRHDQAAAGLLGAASPGS